MPKCDLGKSTMEIKLESNIKFLDLLTIADICQHPLTPQGKWHPCTTNNDVPEYVKHCNNLLHELLSLFCISWESYKNTIPHQNQEIK